MILSNQDLIPLIPNASFDTATLMRCEAFIANCMGLSELDSTNVTVIENLHDCKKLIILDKPIMANLVVSNEYGQLDDIINHVWAIERKCRGFPRCLDLTITYQSGYPNFNALPFLAKNAIVRYLTLFGTGEFNGLIRGMVGDMEFWTDKDNQFAVTDSICQSLKPFKRGF